MTGRTSRRSFLKTATAGAAVLPVSSLFLGGCATPRFVVGRQRHASIGIGGMGETDLAQFSSHPDIEIVALCDIDSGRLAKAGEKFPGARLYQDWRELLTEEAGNLDSVNVTTPDHMHAPIAFSAMEFGLHVYCQKPLTHTVVEARRLRESATRNRVVTQMGIQNHSNKPYAQARAMFVRRPVGAIKEVHVWTDRPAGWWPQGVGRPKGSDPVPETLDWNGWLGVAPKRPYKEGAYHAFVWRGRLDFGTGAQGDMACHLMDPAPWFLELGDPLSIVSMGPPPTDDTFPLWSQVQYRFNPTRWTDPEGVKVVWYDGKRKPDHLLSELGAGDSAYGNGSLFVGEEGAMMFSPYEEPRLLPGDKYPDVAVPDAVSTNHWHQWVDACFGRCRVSAGFDYSGLLTEIALLGNVALRFPKQELEWDAVLMNFPNMPEADQFLHKTYRKNWAVKNLG